MLKRIARSLLLAGFLSFAAVAAQAKPPSVPGFESWLARYGAAWVARDAVAAGKLFTADATYQDSPYNAAMRGRAGIEEYWRRETADQRDVQFDSKVIAVSGNTGVAHWSAKFRLETSGAIIELDGVFVLEFAASGECTALREWWHVRPSK